MTHKFDERHMQKLDNPQRRLEMPPLETLESLGLRRGDTVADIGCGIGYFTIPAASLVKDSTVYALDVSVEMIREVGKKALEAELPNIKVIKTEEYDLKLEDQVVDFIIMSNVFHEIEDKARMVDEFTRILKNGGRLSLIEFEKKEGSSGPPMGERISYIEVANYLSQKGYVDISKHIISETIYGVSARKL